MYQSYIEAGFNEVQALEIVLRIIETGIKSNNQG
jgi:hypothetical protein